MQLTKAEQRTKTMLAGLIDTEHPVALAVEPFRADAIKRTKQVAMETVEMVRKELAEAGNDLNKCAPYPPCAMNRLQYQTAVARYQLFNAIVVYRKSCLRPDEPHLADISQDRVDRFIQDAAERAAIDYDAFVVKLCIKIGQCDTATIEGNHVWGYSRLYVTKGDVKEIWQTKQIINQSKLGKLFNQWPSRKVKK